nr:ribosome maturation factor RimM [uncultured Cohaesibacter sp.]
MAKEPADPQGKVCIAQFGAAHGVRGEVRIKLFAEDPDALFDYGPLETADGSRQFEFLSARESKTVFVCRIKGLNNRNDVEALTGQRLYVDRDKLPELEEEEFYHSDLIGLDVRLEDGTSIGSIVAIHDFGSGDMLDVMPKRGKGYYIPFTREVVPELKISEGFVLVNPPEGLLDEADESERAQEGEGVDFSNSPELLDGLNKE